MQGGTDPPLRQGQPVSVMLWGGSAANRPFGRHRDEPLSQNWGWWWHRVDAPAQSHLQTPSWESSGEELTPFLSTPSQTAPLAHQALPCAGSCLAVTAVLVYSWTSLTPAPQESPHDLASPGRAGRRTKTAVRS